MRARSEIMVSSIEEEEGGARGVADEPVAAPGERLASDDSSLRSPHSSVSSVQITIMQCDDDADSTVEPPTEETSGIERAHQTILIDLGKCERSLSVDVPSIGQRGAADQAGLLDTVGHSGFSRLDRSHSCGPTPTIVVNWNPESSTADSQLASGAPTKLEQQQPTHEIGAEQQPANALGGSQGSGLSIMSSLPMAASQVRKQSMMLLSSITTRSSQTLRRLSMVATHPVDSLLNRVGKARADDMTSTTSATTSEDEGPDGRGRRKKRRARRSSNRRPESSMSGSAPKRTFDDYLMAVTGVDGSSSSDDDYDDEEDEEDAEESRDAPKFSLLVRQDRDEPSLIRTSSGRASAQLDRSPAEVQTRIGDGSKTPTVQISTNEGSQQVATTEYSTKLDGKTQSREEDDDDDQEDSKRPPSVLHRQGAYYERATSRTGKAEAEKSSDSRRTIQNGSIRSGSISLIRDNQATNDGGEKQLSRELADSMVAGKPGRRRGAKRTSRWHAKRLHAETKAAKTVAIIIGGFIFCWLPFFTAYLSRAIICDHSDCIPQSLLSVFIWLGYLNSAINPLIYGLFSTDFRHAFKNIICRCSFRNTDDAAVVSVLVDSIIKSIL